MLTEKGFVRLSFSFHVRELKRTTTATATIHVRYKSLNISFPSSAKLQREMTKFCAFWRTWATTANLSLFFLELITGNTHLVSASLQTNWCPEQIQMVTKFKYVDIVFTRCCSFCSIL